MRKNLLLRILLYVTTLQLSITGCKKDDPTTVIAGQVSNYDANVTLAWNKVGLMVERHSQGFRPPIAARAWGYIGLAAYESTISGMSGGYKSLAPTYAGLVIPKADKNLTYHWPTVLNACYARSFRLFFPNTPLAQANMVNKLERDFNNSLKVIMPADVFNRSQAYGTFVANAIYAYSKTDIVGHDAYLKPTDKTYPNGIKPGEWRRTYPDYTDPLLPKWGECRTMTAMSNFDMLLPAPLPYSEKPTDGFYIQTKEVRDVINNIKAGKDYNGKWIAAYWSDDCEGLTMTPAGRWISITNQVIESRNTDLQKAVVAYAKVGLALCDAGISCWQQKYYWKLERPQSSIRRVFNDDNWSSIMCSSEGVGKSPQFPAYPSGHSTFAAAAAEVLTTEFDQANMFDNSHIGRREFISTPRYFKTFRAMADENAYSRLYIGVHYRMDCKEGLTLGYRVGKRVNALPWK